MLKSKLMRSSAYDVLAAHGCSKTPKKRHATSIRVYYGKDIISFGDEQCWDVSGVIPTLDSKQIVFFK